MSTLAWQTWQAPSRGAVKQAWLFTFADLTALLICFFVMMFALQTLDRPKWEAVKGSFRTAFAPSVTGQVVQPGDGLNALTVIAPQVDGLVYLNSLLRLGLAGAPAWQGVQGQPSADGQTLIVPLPEVARSGPIETWGALASVVRTWENPMAVRVVVPETLSVGEVTQELEAAAAKVADLRARGLQSLTLEIAKAAQGDVLWQLVVGHPE